MNEDVKSSLNKSPVLSDTPKYTRSILGFVVISTIWVVQYRRAKYNDQVGKIRTASQSFTAKGLNGSLHKDDESRCAQKKRKLAKQTNDEMLNCANC